MELNHERTKVAKQEAQLQEAQDQLVVLQKRVGEMTHGNPEKDIQEREKIISEMEALKGNISNGPMVNVFALVIGNLRREITEIQTRVQAARSLASWTPASMKS